MNARKIVTRLALNELVAQWAPRIVIGNLLLVLFSTLFPFDFSFKNGFSVKEITGSFSNSSDLSDQLVNVLLFLPLGFGFTGLLQTKRLGTTAKLATVLIVSAGLSFTVEVLQAFLPSRSSSLSDILTNSLGGLSGFLCFHLWKFQIFSSLLALIEKSKGYLSIKKLTAGFIGYMVLTFLISSALPIATNLSELAPKSYKIMYYELIFIPLGALLALIVTISKGRFIFYVLLMYGGILLPSLLLEGILASESGRSISLENLLLSILITAGTVLIFKVRFPPAY